VFGVTVMTCLLSGVPFSRGRGTEATGRPVGHMLAPARMTAPGDAPRIVRATARSEEIHG
jgi:hypothetical protein